MNYTGQMGRLTADPEIRYGGANNTAIGRFTIAVDRRFKRDGEPTADFHNVTCFGKLAEFAEKYLRKGTKVVVQGEVRNNNYEDKNGTKHYGYVIVADNIEFAESKSASQSNNAPSTDSDGFMTIQDGSDDELPFA